MTGHIEKTVFISYSRKSLSQPCNPAFHDHRKEFVSIPSPRWSPGVLSERTNRHADQST